MSVALLPDQEALAQRIAARVLELIEERLFPIGNTTQRLVDATTLARTLGVSRSWVYEHAAELGCVELPSPDDPRQERKTGPRPRVRFDLGKALAAWTARDSSERSQVPEPPAPVGVVRRRRRRAAQTDNGLLPVKVQEAA